MTKGGSGKPKTLGRLIFGEKRKQHAPPSRHRSAARNAGSTADLSTPTAVAVTNKNPMNIHDWAVWRMQLNEQMGSGMADRRTELKQMRQYLQSNPFYQQHSRDPSNGRYNGVRLLFSIPRAKFKPELLDTLREGIPKPNTTEIEGDTTVSEQKKIRSNSDERTASVTSVSAALPPPPPLPPVVMTVDKTISQLFSKALVGNNGGFLQVNEQMVAADIMRTRRSGRSSFRASDRIHSTLQKAVKDGNVLEKIKAFEMQAAAAQAESAIKLGGLNHRMQTVTSSIQSAAQRTLSPAIVHPIQQPISPIPTQQAVRSNRGHHVHPVQHHRDVSHGHHSRKGAHVLEPVHGDIILRRRTPSQKTVNDEDYSITAISSAPMTTSQGHRHHHHHHGRHHRSSVSRSRHRQEVTYDKRALSNHDISSHKHQHKQKQTTTSSTRRRWLKGRKETPTETPLPSDKQETLMIKPTKSSKSKKKTTEQEKTKVSTSGQKEKSSSDNNRVYGVPNTDLSEQTKLESSSLQSPPPPSKIDEKGESDPEKDTHDNTNTYMSPNDVDLSHSKECETLTATTVQQRSSKKYHQQKLSSTDVEILSRANEDTRFSRPTNDHAYDDDDDVFLENPSMKSSLNITRHQSIVNLSNREPRRFQRHTSQCSAEELTSHNRRYQRSNENLLKKRSSPMTLITRKYKINQDEPNVYETPQIPHTLKKKRPFHTITAPGSNSTNNKQISKQILHAIMNSMNNNNNQEQSTKLAARASSVNDEFFENGPLTNPEETLTNITAST